VPLHSRGVPPELGWKTLLPLDGVALEDQYRKSLETLGVKPGMLGMIFKGARCEIHNPAQLKQLIVNLLDKVDWLSLPVDVCAMNLCLLDRHERDSTLARSARCATA
jgi:hypothetical protein